MTEHDNTSRPEERPAESSPLPRRLTVDFFLIGVVILALLSTAMAIGWMAWQANLEARSLAPGAIWSSGDPSLPRLRMLRTLPGTHEQIVFPRLIAGASDLAWSSDGQRLAAFVSGGSIVASWSPDGAIHDESPRYNTGLLSHGDILGFLSGHRQLLVGPAIREKDDYRLFQSLAMSVIDSATGEVVRNIQGLNPQSSWRDNIIKAGRSRPTETAISCQETYK